MIKDNSYYKLKYLKYKSKYINYKNLIGGLIINPLPKSEAVTTLSKPSKPLPLTPQEQQQQQQIELTFRDMYPTIDIARAKMIKLPLLKNTPEYNDTVIRFFIFVDMEFTILPYYELQLIIEHIKNNTLFTGDPLTLDKDVKTILENYLKNYYIPILFINMLKGSKDVNEPIDDISFSSVSNSTSYSSLFNDIIKKISEGLLILHIVSGFSDKELHKYSINRYIIDNDRLFKILVESITDDKDENNGTKILRLFINCIKSSNIDVISKKNMIDKIDDLLITLNNQYVDTPICNPFLHKISESFYPKECYRLRNAHKLSDKVTKLLKQYKKEVEEFNQKKDLAEQKYKELQQSYEEKIKELKTKLESLKSDDDYAKVINEFEKVINDTIKEFDDIKKICIPKIIDLPTQQQLKLYEEKAKSISDLKEKQISLGNYYGVFKSIDADTPENKCRDITIYNRFLSMALLYLEDFIKYITNIPEYIEEKHKKFKSEQLAELKRKINVLMEETNEKIELNKKELDKKELDKKVDKETKQLKEKIQKEKLESLDELSSKLESKYDEKNIPIIPSQSETVF
jgi:hypothetical protein